MAILKGELQDDLGNILYPNTSADQVEGLNGTYVDNISKINKSGKYIIGTDTIGSPALGTTFGCDAVFSGESDGSIIATGFYGWNSFESYVGVVAGGVFKGWKKTASQDSIDKLTGKTNVVSPPNVGYVTETGVYQIYGDGSTQGCLRFEMGFLYNLQVSKTLYGDNNAITQIVTCPYSNTYEKGMYYRTYYYTSEWSEWHKVDTDVKLPFACVAYSGFTILQQDCFVQNNKAHVYVYVQKTDGSNIAGINTLFGSPYRNTGKITTIRATQLTNIFSLPTTSQSITGGIWIDGYCNISITGNECNKLIIEAIIEL